MIPSISLINSSKYNSNSFTDLPDGSMYAIIDFLTGVNFKQEQTVNQNLSIKNINGFVNTLNLRELSKDSQKDKRLKKVYDYVITRIDLGESIENKYPKQLVNLCRSYSSPISLLPEMALRVPAAVNRFGNDYIDYLTVDDFKELPGLVRFTDSSNRPGIAVCLVGKHAKTKGKSPVFTFFQRYVDNSNTWVVAGSDDSFDTDRYRVFKEIQSDEKNAQTPDKVKSIEYIGTPSDRLTVIEGLLRGDDIAFDIKDYTPVEKQKLTPVPLTKRISRSCGASSILKNTAVVAIAAIAYLANSYFQSETI